MRGGLLGPRTNSTDCESTTALSCFFFRPSSSYSAELQFLTLPEFCRRCAWRRQTFLQTRQRPDLGPLRLCRRSLAWL